MKDEVSDIDVPEDDGSDSDTEDSGLIKLRPTRNGLIAGMCRFSQLLSLLFFYI